MVGRMFGLLLILKIIYITILINLKYVPNYSLGIGIIMHYQIFLSSVHSQNLMKNVFKYGIIQQ